jgi:phosphoesterase RecJ-like protein
VIAPLAARDREQIGPAVAAITDARRVLLVCHINPDGDTLGSMIALGLALEGAGKRVTMLSADGVPDLYAFLPAADRIVRTTDRNDFDLAVVLDAGDLSRVGAAQAVVDACPRVIDIDHHVTAGQFGDIRLLDATAAATGEIVYDLLVALSLPLTLPIAEALLCALLTDTGSFRFMNVTPRTMEVAGEMIRLGASPNTIAECVFENKPFAAQKLLGRALDSLRRSDDGRVVWAHVTQDDFTAFAATDADTEGVVNAIRAVRGTQVALFLREMPSGKLRVSLRSRDPVDVSRIAAVFGGGGHRLASGCTLEGPLAAAEARLVAEVERHLRGELPPLPPPCGGGAAAVSAGDGARTG